MFAHSKGTDRREWQPLAAHLLAVGQMASIFADKFSSSDWAWNLGMLHDIGKADDSFQKYLLTANGLDDSEYSEADSTRPNHSSAGATFAEECFPDIPGLTMAYAIAGHHAGLPDYEIDNSGNAALIVRKKEGEKNLVKIRKIAETIRSQLKPVNKPPLFVKRETYHLWTRMLYSCLVDADFLDTEAFMTPANAEVRKKRPSLTSLKTKLDNHLEHLMANAIDNKVNAARRKILEACRAASTAQQGIFSLAVPTGGGKTLAGMSFALNHAIHRKKLRIIYVIPYTSIIEQTADVFREIFGDENIVEHHCNIDPENETLQSHLASENWDAPITITTNVQFFESLYSAKPGRCRKLHNIVNSVVILDEAQLIPPKWLHPCVDLINQLTRHYGTTVVLSTATQPALPDIDGVQEILPGKNLFYQNLKRVEYVFPPQMHSTPTEWDSIAADISLHERVLCIVNTRRDCYDLWRAMPPGTIHLSALMCGEHRSRTIALIKEKLANNQPIRVISTQLVEAGVDIDFPIVYRALAGLDSIAQAAGRCNREGKINGLGKVNIFLPPKAAPKGLLLKGENTTRELLSLGDFCPDSPDEYTRYFNCFYAKVNDDGHQWLKENLITNVPKINFRTAGAEFRLIDDSITRTVFVRHYGDAESLLRQIEIAGPNRAVMRRLQRYSINLSKYYFDKAMSEGLVSELTDGLWCWQGRYDSNIGVDVFDGKLQPEELIF